MAVRESVIELMLKNIPTASHLDAINSHFVVKQTTSNIKAEVKVGGYVMQGYFEKDPGHTPQNSMVLPSTRAEMRHFLKSQLPRFASAANNSGSFGFASARTGPITTANQFAALEG
ncbi:hypothetical protein HDV05_008744, partial [Chytridiales sp. JEL 0842]